ncbi:hypothetical protein PG990_007087 [Apiospora arundinis]
MLDTWDLVREKFGSSANQPARPGGGRPDIYGKRCYRARDRQTNQEWQLSINPEAFAYGKTEVCDAKKFPSSIKCAFDNALGHLVTKEDRAGGRGNRKVVMLAHDANFEWHVLEQFDLKPWLDSVGVDVVDIQSWPIWVKHVQHSSRNFQNKQPGASKVLAGVNAVSEWVHPETKQVYHLVHNSGNDAHHLILSYLRTVFMPSEFTPSFEIGLPIPDEHRLQPKINKAGLLRNIARYGEDPKSDPRPSRLRRLCHVLGHLLTSASVQMLRAPLLRPSCLAFLDSLIVRLLTPSNFLLGNCLAVTRSTGLV